MPFVLMKTIMRLIRLINKNRLPLFQNQIQIFLLYKINVVLLAGADELPSARAVGLSSVCLSTRGYPWTDTSQDSEQYGFFLSSRIYAHCPLLIAQTHGHWCRILFLRLRLLSLSLHNWRWGEERRENCHRTADNDLLTYWSLSPPPPSSLFPHCSKILSFFSFSLAAAAVVVVVVVVFPAWCSFVSSLARSNVCTCITRWKQTVNWILRHTTSWRNQQLSSPFFK